jgi:hypothetical protein
MNEFSYEQTTGNLYALGNVVQGPICVCYSGFGNFKNDPASQGVSDLGPIPQGDYVLGSFVTFDGGRVRNAVPLTPDPANQMFGRTGFYIHGDSNDHPGQASQGCIICPDLAVRQKIVGCLPAILHVVRGPGVN